MIPRHTAYTVRLDNTTGAALDAWEGEDMGEAAPQTTHYGVRAASLEEARREAERFWVLMAPVRRKRAAEALMTTLRPGRFVLPGGDETGTSFAGYTYGHTWNGWARPFFAKEVADQLMAEWNVPEVPSLQASYDPAADTYTFADTENDYAGEAEQVRGEPHTLEGKAVILYPVGTGYWCWDEVRTCLRVDRWIQRLTDPASQAATLCKRVEVEQTTADAAHVTCADCLRLLAHTGQELAGLVGEEA